MECGAGGIRAGGGGGEEAGQTAAPGQNPVCLEIL